MKEIWRDIEGYKGKYQVSNMGRVKSLNYNNTGKEGIMEPHDNGKGYLRVQLCKDGKGKWYRINRLVAQAFLPNPNNLPEVNHIDKDKTNNKVENLEWCTTQYNVEYSQAKAVIGINKVSGLILEFPSIMEAERQTGISNKHICDCLKGRNKSAKGYYWFYASYSEEVANEQE